MRAILSMLAFIALALPAFAQSLPGTAATPDSPEALIGDGILFFVDGRTRDEAGGDDFNPFAIDPDSLLFHVGAFFIVSDFSGEALKEGELAIYPQFAMPRGEGTPGPETPAIIPFAVMRQGACYGGYVAGFPVPDTTYALDMTGALCHADTVEQLVRDGYAAQAPTEILPEIDEVLPAPAGFNPAAPLDSELQNAVYVAYNAAYERAVANPDYVFWDGTDFAPVRAAISAALAEQGLAALSIAQTPVATPAEARACAAPGTTELRIAFTPDRTGISVAAASATRVYAYEYDYAVSPELRVTELRDCATSAPGRARSRSL